MLRRALRHAFTILSALSLLLCVAVCVLWVRSANRIEDISQRIRSDDGYWYLNAAVMRRELGLAVVTMYDPEHGTYYDRWLGFQYRSKAWGDPTATLPWAFSSLTSRTSGVRWYTPDHPRIPKSSRGTETELQVIVPLWMLAVLFAVLPCWSSFRLMVRLHGCKRAKLGLCTKCGYDVRASPERCPECGTVVTKSV